VPRQASICTGGTSAKPLARLASRRGGVLARGDLGADPLRHAVRPGQSRTAVNRTYGPITVYIQSCSAQASKVMRYSSRVKPISYLKANAAEVLAQLAEQREPLVITQNGEAKAVLQDIKSFDEAQQTLALLKILALGNQDAQAGRVKPVGEVVARLRAKRADLTSA
jgi:prevent-host-death family protein